jgi:hypothetical protein
MNVPETTKKDWFDEMYEDAKLLFKTPKDYFPKIVEKPLNYSFKFYLISWFIGCLVGIFLKVIFDIQLFPTDFIEKSFTPEMIEQYDLKNITSSNTLILFTLLFFGSFAFIIRELICTGVVYFFLKLSKIYIPYQKLLKITLYSRSLFFPVILIPILSIFGNVACLVFIVLGVSSVVTNPTDKVVRVFLIYLILSWIALVAISSL